MSQNPFDAFDASYKASLNNAYRDAEVKSRRFTMLPEGKYQCIISSYEIKPSEMYADELTLKIGFEVISGDQKGIVAYKFYQIIPERMDTLKTDMTMLGIDLTGDISILGTAQTANKIVDLIVDITVRHKKKTDGKGFYQNIFINRCLGKAENNEFTEVDDDELPFE